MPSTGTISPCCTFNRARRLKLRPGTPVQASSRIPKTRPYPPTGRVSTATHPWPTLSPALFMWKAPNAVTCLSPTLRTLRSKIIHGLLLVPCAGRLANPRAGQNCHPNTPQKSSGTPPVPVVPCAMAHFILAMISVGPSHRSSVPSVPHQTVR